MRMPLFESGSWLWRSRLVGQQENLDNFRVVLATKPDLGERPVHIATKRTRRAVHSNPLFLLAKPGGTRVRGSRSVLPTSLPLGGFLVGPGIPHGRGEHAHMKGKRNDTRNCWSTRHT